MKIKREMFYPNYQKGIITDGKFLIPGKCLLCKGDHELALWKPNPKSDGWPKEEHGNIYYRCNVYGYWREPLEMFINRLIDNK